MCICINDRDFVEWTLLTLELFAACVTIFSLISLMPAIREWRYKSKNNIRQKKRLKELINDSREVIYYNFEEIKGKDFLLINGKYCWIADEKTIIQIRVYFENKGCKMIKKELNVVEKIKEGDYIKLF